MTIIHKLTDEILTREETFHGKIKVKIDFSLNDDNFVISSIMAPENLVLFSYLLENIKNLIELLE